MDGLTAQEVFDPEQGLVVGRILKWRLGPWKWTRNAEVYAFDSQGRIVTYNVYTEQGELKQYANYSAAESAVLRIARRLREAGPVDLTVAPDQRFRPYEVLDRTHDFLG